MADVQIRTQPTPNPNAILFHVDRTVTEQRMRQYSSPSDASGDPLATALFAIEGVVTVFFMPNSVTVTKEPERDWNAIAPAAEEAIRDYFTAR